MPPPMIKTSTLVLASSDRSLLGLCAGMLLGIKAKLARPITELQALIWQMGL